MPLDVHGDGSPGMLQASLVLIVLPCVVSSSDRHFQVAPAGRVVAQPGAADDVPRHQLAEVENALREVAVGRMEGIAVARPAIALGNCQRRTGGHHVAGAGLGREAGVGIPGPAGGVLTVVEGVGRSRIAEAVALTAAGVERQRDVVVDVLTGRTDVRHAKALVRGAVARSGPARVVGRRVVAGVVGRVVQVVVRRRVLLVSHQAEVDPVLVGGGQIAHHAARDLGLAVRAVAAHRRAAGVLVHAVRVVEDHQQVGLAADQVQRVVADRHAGRRGQPARGQGQREGGGAARCVPRCAAVDGAAGLVHGWGLGRWRQEHGRGRQWVATSDCTITLARPSSALRPVTR
jgi:hypothetical protein